LHAYRDLCPPELALRYAQLQFCREKNAAAAANSREEKEQGNAASAANSSDAKFHDSGVSSGATSSAGVSQKSGGQEGGHFKTIHLVRNYKIFEKKIPA
jgi:hypothetical protein